jgi:hypothetical protein
MSSNLNKTDISKQRLQNELFDNQKQTRSTKHAFTKATNLKANKFIEKQTNQNEMNLTYLQMSIVKIKRDKDVKQLKAHKQRLLENFKNI